MQASACRTGWETRLCGTDDDNSSILPTFVYVLTRLDFIVQVCCIVSISHCYIEHYTLTITVIIPHYRTVDCCAGTPVSPTQVGEFVRGALQYGDSVALAVGMSTPPDNDNTSSDPVSSPEYSLVHSVTQAAQAAEEEWAFSQSECGYPNGDTTANKTHGDIEIEEGGGRTSGPSSREAKALGGSARRVTIIPVTPWGNFTPALNALLSFAARDGAELVLFQVKIARSFMYNLFGCT